jgi:hypothetical protein
MIFLQCCPLISFEQAALVALKMSLRGCKEEITTLINLLARYWYFKVSFYENIILPFCPNNSLFLKQWESKLHLSFPAVILYNNLIKLQFILKTAQDAQVRCSFYFESHCDNMAITKCKDF